MKLFIHLIFILASVFYGCSVNAKQEGIDTKFDLAALPGVEEINREPWLNYNKIIAMEPLVFAEKKEVQLLLLIRKAQAENLLYFYKDFVKTVKLIEQQLDHQTPIKYSAISKFYSGLVASRDSQYMLAEDYFEQAISQAKAANFNRVFVMAKMELAHTRSLTELYETSLIELQEAYLKAYTLEDQYLIALINETYGTIYGFMREYEQSVEYHQKAIDTFKSLKFRAHIADATYGLASTYRYWGKYDLAIQNYEYYSAIISYTPNTDVSFYSAYGLGMTYAEKKACQQALLHIEEALELNGLIDYNAELYKRKASCLIQLNRLDEAEAALKSAEDIFASLPELLGTQWDLETQKIRAFLYHGLGNKEQSFQQINQYYEKHVALLRKNSSERLVKVRATLDNERQNVEYVLLEQRSKVQALLVEQQQQRNLQQTYLLIIGVVIIVVIVLVMITQRRNNQKVLALSIRDSLSSLYNRRYIFDYIDRLMVDNNNEKTSLTLIMLDIDNFKELNDQYGHPFGDKVIVGIADICNGILRYQDVMGRIGGEEFLCVLPRLPAAQSTEIAERMRAAVEKAYFETEDGETIGVTVSIGIACSSKYCIERNALYSHADKALYESKRQGKNTVTFFTEVHDRSDN